VQPPPEAPEAVQPIALWNAVVDRVWVLAGYGDGNDTGQIAVSTWTTIYSHPGTYFASVTVVDANGLSDSASMTIAVNATLTGSNWHLANTLPGTSITLDFGNGTLSGFAGCNNYNAQYTTTLAAGNANAITVGPVTSTGQMYSEEIMNPEQAYLANLQSASSYVVNGATLTVQTAGGPLAYSAALATPAPAQ
jgi:heat shock protein HslJ